MSLLGFGIVVALGSAGAEAPADSLHPEAAPPPRSSLEWLTDNVGARFEEDARPDLSPRDPGEFRRWLYDAVGTLDNRRLRAEFYARYPTPASFDRSAFKEFLMLDPSSTVLGVDTVPAAGETRALLRAGAMAARDDGRYRGRFFRTGDAQPLVDERGDTVPIDPAVLNVGTRTGAGSDSYAWLALTPDRPTEDAGALARTPWNVVKPVLTGDTVLALGPEYGQIYADLAVLALLADVRPGGLPHLFGGASLAHLAGAALPLNTLQFGPAAIHPTPRPGIVGRIRQWLRLGRPEPELDHTAVRRAVRLRLVGARLPDEMSWGAPPGANGGDLEARAALDAPWAQALALRAAREARESGSDAFVSVQRLLSEDGRNVELATLDRTGSDRFGNLIDTEAVEGGRSIDRLRDLHREHLARLGSVATAWSGRWAEAERVREDPEAAARLRQRILTRFVSRQLEYLSEAELRRTRFMVERGPES